MTNEEITAGNKLIAEFMRVELWGDKVRVLDRYGDIEYDACLELEYHTSWNWLMPVVEKIESLSIDIYGDSIKYFSFEIKNEYCNIMGYTNTKQPGCYFQTIYQNGCKSKIQAVYAGVTSFISQYIKS